MNDQTQTPQTLTYRVGDWLVSPAGCRLTRNGTDVRISPRSMEVLVHLIERVGDTVTNDELLEAYWIGGVTSTNAVHKAIGELRQVFGDDRHVARYIETVQKRGYRLVADVARIEVPSGAPLNGPGPKNHSDPEPMAEVADINGTAPIAAVAGPIAPSRPGLTRIAAYAVAALVLIAAGAAGLYRTWSPFTALVDRVTEYCFASCETEPASVAVLPFDNLSGDSADAFYGSGMVEAIGAGLARVDKLQVKTAGVAFMHDTAGRSLSDRAALLGVNHVLEGTVQRSGDRVRVSVQLMRAADGAQLYSQQFDEPVARLFELQDDISAEVAKALSVHLDEGKRGQMLNGGTTNVDAYLAMLEAHYRSQRPGRDDALKVIDASRRAIALDRKYVDAYWCLVEGLSHLAQSGLATPAEYQGVILEIAEIAERAAVELPASGLNFATRVKLAELNDDLVEREFLLRELIKHVDSPARQHMLPEHKYADLLLAVGLFDDSKAYAWLEMQRHGSVPEWVWEPFSITQWREDGLEAVIPRWKSYITGNPGDIAGLSGLVVLLARAGRYEEAQQYLDQLKAADQSGGWSHDAQGVLDVYRGTLRTGSPELATFLGDPRTSALSAGRLLFMLGDIDGGIARWERMDSGQRALLHDVRLLLEYHFPKEVRADPRYQALLDRLGIGEKWRHHLEDGVRELEPFTGIGLAADHPDKAPPGIWRWKM